MLNFIQPGDALPKAPIQRPDEADEIIQAAENLKIPEPKKVKHDAVDEAAQLALPYIGVAVLATWVGATLDLARTVDGTTALATALAILLIGTAVVAIVSAVKPRRAR
jgi:hypothetical protein